MSVLAADFSPDHKLVIGGDYAGTPDMDPVGIQVLPFGNDPFVAQYSIPFSLDWVAPIAADAGRVYGVAVSQTGQVAIVGDADGTNVDFDPGPAHSQTNMSSNINQAFAAVYSANGDFEWAKRLVTGDVYTSYGSEVGFDVEGNLFVQGVVNFIMTSSSVDLDPGAGTATFGGQPFSCCNRFIQKLGNDGTYQWAQMAWTVNLSVDDETKPIALLDDVLVIGGEITNFYADRTFQAPGHVITPLPDCNGDGSSHYLAGLDRNSGAILWVIHDTTHCDGLNGSFLDGFDVAPDGTITLFGSFNGLMDGSMGLTQDILTGVGPEIFISRFNTGDISTAVADPLEAYRTSTSRVVRACVMDMHGRRLLNISGRMVQSQDLYTLSSGVYLIAEWMEDGSMRAHRSVRVD